MMVERCWSAAAGYLRVSMMFNDVFQGLGKSKPKGLLLPCCVSKSVLLSLGNSVPRQILPAGELSTRPCARWARSHLCRSGRSSLARDRGSACRLGSCLQTLAGLRLFLSMNTIYLLLPSPHTQLPLLFFVFISSCCLCLVVKSREQEDGDYCLHPPEQQHCGLLLKIIIDTLTSVNCFYFYILFSNTSRKFIWKAYN